MAQAPDQVVQKALRRRAVPRVVDVSNVDKTVIGPAVRWTYVIPALGIDSSNSQTVQTQAAAAAEEPEESHSRARQEESVEVPAAEDEVAEVVAAREGKSVEVMMTIIECSLLL